MQAVYLRPLVLKALKRKCNLNLYKGYGLVEGTVDKINECRYEVNEDKLDDFYNDILDLTYQTKCIPAYVGSEEDCIEFEESVMAVFNNLSGKDILWLEPIIYTYSDGRQQFSALDSNLDVRVIMGSGKSFMISKYVYVPTDSCEPTDFRLIKSLNEGLTSDDLNGAKNVKSKSQVLYHIISTAFNETLKHIIKHYRQDLTFLDYESIFVECDKVSSCCNNLDGVVKILQKNILTDRNALDNIKVKVKFDEKFQYGIWTDGCSQFDFSTAKKVTEFVSYTGNKATIRLKERCD